MAGLWSFPCGAQGLVRQHLLQGDRRSGWGQDCSHLPGHRIPATPSGQYDAHTRAAAGPGWLQTLKVSASHLCTVHLRSSPGTRASCPHNRANEKAYL